MVEPPHYLAEDNLSRAWARAFLAAMAPGVDDISPLCVAVTGLDEGRPAEDADIRDAVDRALKAHGKLSVHTVANTIFPASRWKKPELGHQVLFERYAKMLPTIKKADARNRNGTYFERMISFGPDKINQLKHIIDTYSGGIAAVAPFRPSSSIPPETIPTNRSGAFPACSTSRSRLSTGQS